jgi:transcriptional regulator with XRE-family HTH domain
MILGRRLRALRDAKKLSQADVEKRTGLARSYISRVEHGHTVPSLETLERLAAGLEIPLYQLFYEGNDLPSISAKFGAAEDSTQELATFEHIRRQREKESKASDDARLAFRTLAMVFSKL